MFVEKIKKQKTKKNKSEIGPHGKSKSQEKREKQKDTAKNEKTKKTDWNPVPGWAPQGTCEGSKNCKFPNFPSQKNAETNKAFVSVFFLFFLGGGKLQIADSGHVPWQIVFFCLLRFFLDFNFWGEVSNDKILEMDSVVDN